MSTPPKFADLEYRRPDFTSAQRELNELAAGAEAAGSMEELLDVIRRMDSASEETGLPCALAMIHCYLDSSDPEYAREMQFCGQGNALLDDAPLITAILNNPHAPELDGALGPNFRLLLQDQFRVSAQAKDLQAQEEELINRYQQLKANIRIPFRGEALSEGRLNHMLEDTDRATRREASLALHTAFAEKAGEFQELLDELIRTRIAIAKANGFERYMDYANLCKGRRGYGQRELLDFCRQVREELLPLLERLYRRQAERLGLDSLKSYDVPLTFPDGNARPIGDGPAMMEAAKAMYDQIGTEIGAFYRTMADLGYIDVTSSPNKIANMGFCTFLTALKMPYIFGNCDGSIHDASILTHEFGHAWQGHLTMEGQPVELYMSLPNDVVEIPSKAMEQFTAPFANLFFGETAGKFASHHMKHTVEEICIFCATHEYETWLYGHPQASGEERVRVFNEITEAYSPAVDFSELRELRAQGAALFRSMGVFMFPAYVISYALSDMGALELRGQAQADFSAAWAHYTALCRAGGSLDYDQLMAAAGLSTAYAHGAVARAARTAEAALRDYLT